MQRVGEAMSFIKKRYKNFEDLYHDNEKIVYIFISDHVSDFHQITDLAQQIWYEVFLNWDKFEGKEKKDVQNYLRAMAKNLVSDYFAEKKKEDELTEAFLYLYGKEDITCLEKETTLFIEVAPQEFLEEALLTLDDGERNMLHLKYKEKLQSDQIGEIYDITAAAARVRLQRIREFMSGSRQRVHCRHQVRKLFPHVVKHNQRHKLIAYIKSTNPDFSRHSALFVLLLFISILFQLRTIRKCVSDLITQTDVSVMHWVESDWVKFCHVNHSVVPQNLFVRTYIHNLTDHSAVFGIIGDEFTFHSHRQFFDDWRIHIFRFLCVESRLFELVWHLVSGNHSNIVTFDNGGGCSHAHGERTSRQNILNRLVSCTQAHSDFIRFAYSAPSCIHSIGCAVFAVSRNDEYWLWVQQWFRAKIFSHNLFLLVSGVFSLVYIM